MGDHPGPATAEVTRAQLAWFRLRRSGLVDGFADGIEAAQRLIGVQAQVLSSAGLAISARVGDFTTEALEELLYADRHLVKLWGQRRTLHLYGPTDWPPLYALFRDVSTWAEQAVKRTGGDPDDLARAARDVGALLKREGGTLTRAELQERRPELEPYLDLGIGLFMDVVQRGDACHAEPDGPQSTFAHRTHWLPELAWTPPDRDVAGRDWTRRFLATYGPARPHDVAFWMGTRVTDARRWLRALEGDCVPVRLEDDPDAECVILGKDLDDLTSSPPRLSTWPVRLLHKYDPLMLAHADKDWIVDGKHYKAVWRHAGIVEGVVLLDGRIAGVWNYRRRTHELDVDIQTFRSLPRRAQRQIAKEAERVAGHFGLAVGRLEVE